MSNNATTTTPPKPIPATVPDVEVVSGDEETTPVPKPTAAPLADPQIAAAAAAEEAAMEEAFEQPMIDEQLLAHTCHQLFDLYQKTGQHEVRRLAMLVAQMGAAVLGADPREFFPEAPPIRDSGDRQGAPTFAGAPQQGYPQAQVLSQNSGRGGFTPTQPVVTPTGVPLAVAIPVAQGQVHESNPSGAEMIVVSDPGGTMQNGPGGTAVNPNYQPPPVNPQHPAIYGNPNMAPVPTAQAPAAPQFQRRRRVVRG